MVRLLRVNSSGINDGAASLLIASEAAVKKYGLTPMARIVSYAAAGVAPEIMGYRSSSCCAEGFGVKQG